MHISTRVRPALLAVVSGACAVALLVPGAASAGASAPLPEIVRATGGGGVPVLAGFTSFDLADVGYEQSEVFFSGTATAYQAAAPDAGDGKVDAVAASTAPYTSRAVVVRPTDRRRFNGTVIVEWLNVSGGADAGPDWMLAHNELVREGFVWIGVSAQRVGLEALKSEVSETNGRTTADAVRYASLSHPGDEYANDIFSQAGQAIRDQARTVLGGLKPKHVIAIGESQAAGRLVGYVNLVHPITEVYDGYLLHSRFGGAPIRDDLDAPVLTFQTEGDVLSTNGAGRQPDTDTHRLWEVAGTAHYDLYGLGLGREDTGDGEAGIAMLESMLDPPTSPSPRFDCGAPINTGQARYVLSAAFFQLNRWVTKGIVPPSAPRLETTSDDPIVFATDADGNALGGIRTPSVDAPVATLTGKSTGGTSFCFLFGSTTPFTPERLQELYPSHRAFVDAWTKATKSAQAAGFLVRADAKELIAAAKQSDIGK